MSSRNAIEQTGHAIGVHDPEALPGDQEEKYVWKMRFSCGKTSPQVEKGELVAARTNFFLGNDSTKWRTKVPEYDQIVYREVWKGIDVRFFLSEEGALKYEFLLAPGADPEVIRIEFEGLEGVEVLENGELQLNHPWGLVKEEVPYSFTANRQQEIEVHYRKIGKNSYGFQVDSAPQQEAWVIDPLIVSWSSFGNVSSGGANYSYDVSSDQFGNLYMTGSATSGFPPTPGAYQGTFGGIVDAFVAKFSSDGSNMLFMTYLGGSGIDEAYSLEVAPSGRVYVCGRSKSTNFPVTPGTISANTTTSDSPFVTCLNSTGTALVYSTFLCPSCIALSQAIATVSNDEVIVSGTHFASTAPPFPTTPGAYLSSSPGLLDVWVCRINSTGSGLIWSTMLGTPGTEELLDIAVNDLEEPYLVGTSDNPSFPVTPGAFQTTAASSFITRFNATGTGLIYSSWFPPSSTMQAIDVHPVSREAFAAGSASSGAFAGSPGSFQTAGAGGNDAFVTRINASGSAMVYSTFLGGTGDDLAMGIAVKENNEVYVSGATSSSDFPTNSCQFQTTHGGGYDMFLAHFNPTGSGVGKAGISYFGGLSNDYNSARVELREAGGADTLYCSLTSHSTNFPTTPGSFQPVKLNGSSDCPVAMKLVPFSTSLPDTSICNQDSIEIKVPPQIDNITWSTGGNSASTWISQPGSYWISGTLYGCPFTDTFQVANSQPTLSLGPDTTFCAGGSLSIGPSSTPGNTYLWNTGATTPMINASSPGSYWLVRTDTTSGCSASDTIALNVLPGPTSAFTVDPTHCPQVFFTDGSTNATSWNWNFGEGGTSALPSPSHNYATAGNGTYTVTLVASGPCGSDTSTQTLNIDCVVGVKLPSNLSVNVFPNPSQGVFQIEVKGLDEDAHLRVFNNMGQLVHERMILGQQGDYVATIELLHPAPGGYLMDLNMGGARMVKKIMVE